MKYRLGFLGRGPRRLEAPDGQLVNIVVVSQTSGSSRDTEVTILGQHNVLYPHAQLKVLVTVAHTVVKVNLKLLIGLLTCTQKQNGCRLQVIFF